MKEIIYPNYRDLYYLKGNTVVIKRRCYDGVVRHINTLEFPSNKAAKKYFEEEV